jgi:NAD(P)H-hydrate epimerase
VIYVLTPDQMRAVDAQAAEHGGSARLMRDAGARVAEEARRMVPPGSRIVAVAGPGNNGGDAFAALADLGAQYDCTVVADPSASGSAGRLEARERAQNAGIRFVTLDEARDAPQLFDNALAVDGMFGTGARLPLPEAYRPFARALDARRRRVLAIDIPSGTDALTGAVSEDAVRATVTVTLAALKPGLLLEPAREYAGEVRCAAIGIEAQRLAAQPREFATLDDSEFLNLLPQRQPDSDKRAAGAPLVVAGSPQFPGAAVLCSLGAARAGAGYVTVATPAGAASALRSHLVEQVVVEIPAADGAERVVEDLLGVAKRCGSIGIGPGLGLDDRTGAIVIGLLANTELPAVVDASALFHLSKHLDILGGKACVLTPHAGEFARLSGKGTIAPGTRVARLREFVERTGVTTLLKGSDTLIYDGTTMHINPTGTNALATAGTGDVLTGIIATLLSQGLSPVDAARAGAYWHGLAGRLAAQRRRIGVIASDVIAFLGDALPLEAQAMPAT